MREATRARMISIMANALIEEPLVRVPGGLSANRKLSSRNLPHQASTSCPKSLATVSGGAAIARPIPFPASAG